MITSQAILIRNTRLTDTSLIVHWFTQEHGLVKTVAKGALRPKSPFSGKLDLFFSAEITVVRAKKGELHALKEVAVSGWRQGLRRDYSCTLMAGYFCQLVGATVELEHPDAPIHDLLERGLDYLDEKSPNLKAMVHFERQLVEILGIHGGVSSAEEALREHLGSLPASRRQLVERLGDHA